MTKPPKTRNGNPIEPYRLDPRLTADQQRFCVYHKCAQPGCDDPSAAAEKHEKLDDKSRFCAQHTPEDPPPPATKPSGPDYGSSALRVW
ncbi:hypothetical protein PG994_011747 [Apiospora phragmitis]|uniref:Uncharacterized protein n=1 Tax=Apiospora phragmitis TaxID=2905665 RepID=A0ABR1TU06_9PEZI